MAGTFEHVYKVRILIHWRWLQRSETLFLFYRISPVILLPDSIPAGWRDRKGSSKKDWNRPDSL